MRSEECELVCQRFSSSISRRVSSALEKMKELLIQSMMEYFEATRTLPEGQTDKLAITDGAPLAAVVCVLSNEAFPEAVKLVRYCHPRTYVVPPTAFVHLVGARGAVRFGSMRCGAVVYAADKWPASVASFLGCDDCFDLEERGRSCPLRPWSCGCFHCLC